jgi:hypothetical protein
MSFMRIRTTVEATQKPVTLADCYGQLRLDPSGSPPTHPDDALLTRLIGSATAYVEQVTRRALCKQTILLTYRRFPYDRYAFLAQQTLWSEPGSFGGYDIRPRHITLLRPNLLTLTSVQYYDQANTLQTLDPTWYIVHSDQEPATIELLEGYFWPVLYIREDAVQLTYDAGYTPFVSGSPPTTDYAKNVPDSIKQAILLRVQQDYDAMTPDKWNQLQGAIDALLGSYRVFNF